MFEKKSQNKISSDDNLGVFKPSKGSAKVIIGDGVKFKGEINDADEIQIDVLLSTDAGSGAAYKLKSVRISQGDTVYGIKGPNIPPMIATRSAFACFETRAGRKPSPTSSGCAKRLRKNFYTSYDFWP